MKKILFVATLLAGINTWGQTNPTAQILPYTQNFNTLTGSSPAYPAGWQGWDVAGSLSTSYVTTAPNADRAITVGSNTSSTRGVYDMTGKLGVIATGSSLSTAALSINTIGLTSISVSYKAGTQRNENNRINGLGLQYRVGTSGTFINVASSEYNNIQATSTSGNAATNVQTISVTLPAGADNAAVIQLRWMIRDVSGSGNRPGFSIDDISISGTSMGPTITTDPVGAVTATTAVLNGKVKANNTTVATSFGYSTDTSYGSSVTSTSPSSISGNTETSFTGTATGLTPNTTYNYRASGNNGTIYNGSNATFLTLAAVPGAPAISNATTTSLSVTLNSTTQNSNPATTAFAIQVTQSGLYVQANGTLGATAVWQTAGTWGTVVVSGLSSSTQYTFQVKARNSAGAETAFGATASGTTLAATSPLLSAGTITSFGDVCINTVPADKSFILDGDNLTGNVTVGPLSGFTFSTTSNGTFTTSLTLTPVSGEVLTDIYVRFSPTAVQSYSGNIAISGGGASAINVAAAGAGVNTPATVTTASATSITSTTATLGGNVTAAGCGTVSRGVVYATTATPAIGGTGVTNLTSGTGTGAFTANATGLTGGTLYHVRAYATNNAGTVYGSEITFTTPPANDLCADAATLTVNSTATSGTFVGSTFTTFTNGSSKKDVWYKFTASCSGSHTITLAGFSGDADIYMFSGSSCPTNNNNSVAFAASSNMPEVITYSVTSGVTYYIRAAAWDATAEASTFTIRVQSVNEVPTVTTSTASSVTYQGASLPGTAVVAGCSTSVTGYGIYYSTTNGFADGSGTQVTGSNLTGTNFSVSVTGLAPLTTYYYKAYATNAAGTGYSTQGSFTTDAYLLDAPVATFGDNITTSSFTANWEEVEDAESYRLDVSESSTFGNFTNTTDLLISEYVEGSSSNKYIEIFNGTGASVNLSDYRLQLYANGASSPTNNIQLSGTLANGSTIVYKNSSATAYGGTATNNSAVNFSGDDAVAIYKISTSSFVDIFGKIGEDPGTSWTSSSNNTIDKTLIRKATVTGGVTVNPTTGFPTLETEWTQQNIDVVTDLGSHTYNGQQDDLLPGYANLTVNGLSQVVTGLDANTTYYYRVRAYGNSTTSVNSNPISVLTGFMKIWNAGAWNGNGFPPTLIDDAEIQSNYVTGTNGTFNASNLIVSGGTLTVSATTSITVNGSIDIDGGAMIVESNANVRQNDDDATNNGSVTVRRQSPLLKRLDYKLWSSPVAGQELGAFSPATESNRFYAYNTETNMYNGISNENSFAAGAGYLIRMPNSIGSVPGYNAGNTATNWQGTYFGEPHNGVVTPAVSYYAATPAQGETPALPIRGYNAVGNPYMSTISAGEFYEANADRIDGTFYFWSKTNNTPGSAYVAYSPGLGGTGNGQDAIQVGQGFIINVTNPSATNVVFNNGMRVINNGNASYRNANAASASAPQVTEKHRYWVNLTSAAGVKSQMLVGYTINATNGIDGGIDGKLLADNSAVLYTLADATNLMIQGRPLPFANTDVVAVGYKVLVAANYTIALDHFDGLFAEGQNVYLKDKAANTTHNLSAGPYTFASAVGTFNDRFEIVYVTDGALGTDNPVISAEAVAVYKDGSALNISAGSTEMAAVAIYDIRGRLLYENSAVNATETSVTTLQAAQQVLVVQMTMQNGSKISKKVVF
ncbi:MAG: T9SS sorting signal type C domain-containing protein [Flavobacterium sp.]